MSSETGSGVLARDGSRSSSIDLESIRAIAKKDFQDAVRSWVFWMLSFFFFAMLTVPTVIIWYFAGDLPGTETTTANLIGRVHGMTSLVIPIIALVLGWKSIAGELNSGNIKVMLSLPHSRKDVLLGKLVGRSAVLSVSLTLGFVFAAVFVAALLGGFDVGDYAGLYVVSLLFGIVYTSLGVSISSLTRSTTIAGAAIFATFLLFYILWDALLQVVYLLISFDYLPDSDLVAQVALFYRFFNPNTAYANVLSLVTSFGGLDNRSAMMLRQMFDGIPFYLKDWFALIVLLFWIVVPIAVALYRFDRVDI